VKKANIKQLRSRKILNSNGNWTIECQLVTNQGTTTAGVPTGISQGKEEREASPVEKAINEINELILDKVKNKELDQKSLDELLDAGGWGSNATLAVSAAFFNLNKQLDKPNLPKMMMLMFEGEEHGNPNFTIQEFMVVVDEIEQGVNFYKVLENKLKVKNMLDTVGKEGGFSPLGLNNDKEVLDLLVSGGIKNIALDVAGNVNPPTVNQLVDLVKNYPIISIEDPFPEDDIDSWISFYQSAKEIQPEILIVGDDLTVTDKEKIIKADKEKLINAVIIKPNQQGTITAAVEAVETAKNLGMKTIASHRGESTNDTWIVDFGLVNEVDYVKFGAPARGERIAKYNRLLEFK
jgi:enolase